MKYLFECSNIETATVSVQIDDTVKKLSAAFDYAFDGTSKFIPPRLPLLPLEYGIGLIVGASGSPLAAATQLGPTMQRLDSAW